MARVSIAPNAEGAGAMGGTTTADLYKAGTIRELLSLPPPGSPRKSLGPPLSARRSKEIRAEWAAIMPRCEATVKELAAAARVAERAWGVEEPPDEASEEMRDVLARAVELLPRLAADAELAVPLCKTLTALASGPIPKHGFPVRNGEREALHEAGVVVGAEAIIRAAASEEAVRAALNLIAQVSAEQLLWVGGALVNKGHRRFVADCIVALIRDQRTRLRRVPAELVRAGAREFLHKVFHEGYKTTELKATYSALKEEAKAHSSVSSALQEKIDAAKAARTATGASADHKPTFLEKIGANMDGLRNEFGKLDADGSGAISAAEIKPLLARFDINMTDKMIAKTVKEVDEDDSGELDWFEFLAFVYAYGEGEDALEARFTDVQLEQMRETFALFDASGDGLISLSELSKIMKKLGRKLPREQLQAMMAEVDADGSGNIEWDEFLQFMLLTESNDNDDEYEKAFNMIDKEGRGFLYMEDVANLINQLSPGEITPEELRMMVDESKFEDENSDRLTYKEFVKMVMSN